MNRLLLQLIFICHFLDLSYSHLNLYIFKDDLKKDMDLDFGGDVYLVTDGKPASLLMDSRSFRALVAPLSSTINQMYFRWSSFPLDDNKNIRYTIRLSSSDIEVMPVPTITVPTSSIVPLYEHKESGFKLRFPCSGQKGGLVDLGFHLNYTAEDGSDGQHLEIIVRRHCSTVKNRSGPIDVGNKSVDHDKSNMVHKLMIGFSVAISFLLVILLFCFVNWQLNKKKRELERKLDHDYELLIKKNETPVSNQLRKDISSVKEPSENDHLNRTGLDHTPSPIFVPKTKWKKHRGCERRMKQWLDSARPNLTSSLPSDLKLSSQFGLEKILEEENDNGLRSPKSQNQSTEQHPSVNRNESRVLSNNHALHCNGSSTSKYSKYNKLRKKKNKKNKHSDLDQKDNNMIERDNNSDTDSCLQVIDLEIGDCNQEQRQQLKNRMKRTTRVMKNKKSNEKDSYATGAGEESCNTIPLHRKMNLNQRNVREEEGTSSSIQDKRLQEVYQYLNHKWTKQFQDVLIPQQRLVIGKHPLGKGGSSNIHQGRLRQLDTDENIILTPVAIKTMTSSLQDCDGLTKFFTEALMMRRLKHGNIMSLVGVMLRKNDLPTIVMPFFKHADLNQYLRNARGTPKRHQMISTRQLINFCVQIACGMEYMAAMNFVHRDLATRNCMVGENLEVKISNLGLARDISKENYRMSRKTRLPIKWMAPESLNNFVFSEKSDVWSYGVLLWEIINLGKQPYSCVPNERIQEYLMEGKRLERSYTCPEELYRTMCWCWIESPHDRPSFKELHKDMAAYESTYQKYSIEYSHAAAIT